MSFFEPIPLLAANWLEAVVPIIFFVLWGVGQLLSSREEAKNKKARPPRPAPRPPQGQGPQAGAPARPPNQADQLRTEVEEFLRRAQGKPAQEEPIVLQVDRSQEEPLARQKPRDLRSRGKAQPQRSSLAKPAAPKWPKPQPLEPINLREESVAGHVARHVSTHDITEQTSHLGEEVSQADEQMEAHLKKTFSGQVGSLQHRERIVADEGPSIAEEMRELISNPTGMRQMIVASEILRRPSDRW